MSIRRPLTGPIGFNAQHSPMGAFMSFTIGNPGTRSGEATPAATTIASAVSFNPSDVVTVCGPIDWTRVR